MMDKPVSFNVIFSLATRFVIRQPATWLLGFIIALGLGNFTQHGYDLLLYPSGRSMPLLYQPLITDVPRFDLLPMLSAVVPAWPNGLIMILVLWLGALVAQATLILVGAQVALGQPLRFSMRLAQGVRRVGRVMIVNLLVFGLFYGLILIYVITLLNSPTHQIPVVLEQNYWDNRIMQAGGQYSISQITLCTLFPLNILGLIVYPPFVLAAVLEDMPLGHSLSFGWRLLWANFGRLLGFWALLVGAALVTSFFTLASASTIRRLLADSATAANAVVICVGVIISTLFISIFTVAEVQLYGDCARRLRSAQAVTAGPLSVS